MQIERGAFLKTGLVECETPRLAGCQNMRPIPGLCSAALRKCSTRWFKYDRDYLCVNKSQFVPVIFEPPCITILLISLTLTRAYSTVTELNTQKRLTSWLLSSSLIGGSIFWNVVIIVGRDSSVGTATLYGLGGPGIEPLLERNFPHPSRPALGPTNLLYIGYRVSFPWY